MRATYTIRTASGWSSVATALPVSAMTVATLRDRTHGTTVCTLTSAILPARQCIWWEEQQDVSRADPCAPKITIVRDAQLHHRRRRLAE